MGTLRCPAIASLVLTAVLGTLGVVCLGVDTCKATSPVALYLAAVFFLLGTWALSADCCPQTRLGSLAPTKTAMLKGALMLLCGAAAVVGGLQCTSDALADSVGACRGAGLLLLTIGAGALVGG
eukprot:COSAG05_NODE_6247_length_992_cov_2.106383_1_plen_123_part_01